MVEARNHTGYDHGCHVDFVVEVFTVSNAISFVNDAKIAPPRAKRPILQQQR